MQLVSDQFAKAQVAERQYVQFEELMLFLAWSTPVYPL